MTESTPTGSVTAENVTASSKPNHETFLQKAEAELHGLIERKHWIDAKAKVTELVDWIRAHV